MPAYKDKARGTWYATFYYTDWQGQRHKKKKRGFERKKDAEEFEREFLRKGARSCDMKFSSMVDLYLEDMRPRLRETTYHNKKQLFDTKILPYFKDLKINEITSAHVRRWQAELISKGYKPTYLKTIHNQLSAVFNYAVRYYSLPENPARIAGAMGKKKADSMKFWTVEQFNSFIACVPNFSAEVAFSVLFWTGMRIGELLALSPADVDLKNLQISVTKSFQTLEGEEIVTLPKTDKSVRTIPIPAKLGSLLQKYINALYQPEPEDRLFPYTKGAFYGWMDKGCAASGVERIRLHDLRHSHASLLINMGMPVLMVSERLGHENVETTLEIYGHLYKETAVSAMEKLDNLIP